MKRIIVGEFENFKKIENIILKEKNNFGVFVDFESAIHLGLENYDYKTIVIYLEDMEVFNKYHTFIRENKENIRLLIRSKKVKNYCGILLNEGYSIIDNLDELDKIEDEKRKVSKNLTSPRIFMVSGSFEFAIRLAYHFSRIRKLKTLFVDTDSVNSFTLKRLNLKSYEDLNYLNESMKNRRSHYSTICGKLAIAPIIENTELSGKEQLQELTSLLADNKAMFDIQIVYCNLKMKEVIGRITLISDRQLFIKWLNYESLMEMNKEKIQYGLDKRASVIALKANHAIYNHLLTQKLCDLRIIGVIASKELSGLLSPYRIINLEKSPVKEKRVFCKVMKELLHRERSVGFD